MALSLELSLSLEYQRKLNEKYMPFSHCIGLLQKKSKEGELRIYFSEPPLEF